MRQRFLVCQLLEDASLLKGTKKYKYVEVYPFGSSINGLGKCDSDLDLVLCQLNKSGHSRVYVDRERLESDICEVGDALHRVEGVIVDLVIARARVPIVKFSHAPTGVSCDICVSEDAALPMAELIHVMCRCAPWLPALALTVQLWARHVGLVSHILGGHHVKNIVLTVMIIFYLQQRHLLPPYNTLLSHIYTDMDTHSPADATTHLSNIPPQAAVTANDLDQILLGFFHYYHQFDYDAFGIDVAQGTLIEKYGRAKARALYVCNPLGCEPQNIAYNVSREQFHRLKDALDFALWKFDYYNQGPDAGKVWGIMSLFDQTTLNVKNICGT